MWFAQLEIFLGSGGEGSQVHEGLCGLELRAPRGAAVLATGAPHGGLTGFAEATAYLKSQTPDPNNLIAYTPKAQDRPCRVC